MAQAINNVDVDFPAPTGSPWDAPTHFAINDEMENGEIKIRSALTGTYGAPAVGQTVRFSPGALAVNHTQGEGTESGRLDMLRGLLAGTRYVSLHTGVPTAENELSGNGYARSRIAFAGWNLS